MDRFRYVMIVAFVIICFYELLECIYRHSNRHQATLGGAQKFRNVPSNLEVVNIGSGPGLYGITYDKCYKRGFNFSTAPQNYKYGFRLLKRFEKKICNNAIIIIIIMLPLSFANNGDYNRPDYSDKFYGVLPRKDIDNFSYIRLWITRHPLTVKVIEKIRRQNNSFLGYHYNNTKSNPEVVETWKREFKLYDLLDSSQSSNHIEAFHEKRKIVEEGIRFCKSNGWKPVFVIPPVPGKTRIFISDDFLHEFAYKNIDKILEMFPEIKVFDYYDDDRFSDELFQNDIFLNDQGKILFSDTLFSDLDLT